MYDISEGNVTLNDPPDGIAVIVYTDTDNVAYEPTIDGFTVTQPVVNVAAIYLVIVEGTLSVD